ncbi:ABC transporter ATP-binding protein [Bradyrhizobium sp. 14AA]
MAALSAVSFEIAPGHILGLIGPNGAGKSSLVNVISGTYRANEGSVRLDGVDLFQLKPHQRAALGLSRTFQNLALFGGMTVYENVMVGRHLRIQESALASFLPVPLSGSKDERKSEEVVERLLDRLGISSLRDTEVNLLSYGFQKRVELARALALEPRLLLLDEPFAGMTAMEARELAALIVQIWQETGLTVLIIEHNMGLITDLADRIVVLDFGKVIAVGEPDEVIANPEVIQAYLGTSSADVGALGIQI